MEGHRSEEEADHDRTSAYHRDNGYHGAVQTQCIEICKVGGGEEYADENDLPYIETSSKEGININELFESSIKSFLSNNKYIGGDKNIKLNNQSTNASEKNACC